VVVLLEPKYSVKATGWLEKEKKYRSDSGLCNCAIQRKTRKKKRAKTTGKRGARYLSFNQGFYVRPKTEKEETTEEKADPRQQPIIWGDH